jgi:Tfp pilus assembly protein PilO
MRKKSPLIAVLVAVLLTAGFWFLLYQPKSEEQAELEVEREALLTRQSELRNEIARLEEIQRNEPQISAQLARLETYIPSGPAQSTVIRQFQETADASGVVIENVTFGAPELVIGASPTGEDGTALARLPVTVTIEGGYFQVVDLFRRLEVEVPRAILLGALTMAEGDDGFPTLTTNWSGDIFAVVPVAAIPEVPEGDDSDETDDLDLPTASADNTVAAEAAAADGGSQ